MAEAPTWASDGGQPKLPSGDQLRILLEPSTSAAHHGGGPAFVEQKSPESRANPQSPHKRQRSAGGTPGDGQAKRPKQTGQLSYARAAREAIRVAVYAKIIPEGKSLGITSQISRERSAGLWMGPRKRGSPPAWSTLTGQRGQTLWTAKT